MRNVRQVGVVAALVSAALTATFMAAPSPVAAQPASRSLVSTTHPAKGLTLSRYAEPGPNNVWILRMDPTTKLTLDVETAGSTIGGYARESTIASSNGAVAAINGDFSISPGRPLHPLAEDGLMRELGLQNGASFAMSQDKRRTFVNKQAVNINGRNLTKKQDFNVTDWNTGRPTGNQLAVFTPYGGSAERPPMDACSVRLKPSSKMHWGKVSGVYRDYKVVRRRCQASPMPQRAGAIVLSSQMTGTGSDRIRAMKRGQLIRLTWTFGWAGVMDSIGGMPQIVTDGHAYKPSACNSYFCSRNPRTAIGVGKNGNIMMAVDDGRTRASVGMTLPTWSSFLIAHGMVNGVNLDGGGGSEMWTKVQGVINHPSDGSERPLTNAVLVLPGADPAEPIPLPYGHAPMVAGPGAGPVGGTSAVPLVPAAASARALADSLADPGSTGGLMDALVGGELGRGAVPPSFRRMARAFHAAR